jgi:hypothetical protein
MRRHIMMKRGIVLRSVVLLTIIPAFILVLPAQAQEDFLQIGEYKACTDGVAFWVTGHNSVPGATWENWVTYGAVLAPPLLIDPDTSPMPLGDFTVLLVYYYDPARAALIPVSLPLSPGTLISFDAYQAIMGGGGVIDSESGVPVEACSIDDWLAGPGGPAESLVCMTRVHFFSTDAAPADGVVELYTLFGELFRPEGQLLQSIPISGGERLDMTLELPCEQHVRAWYTPTGGPPALLPSQYYPDGEYGTPAGGEAPSYHTSFAGVVPATD